jgi:cytochrome c-type biogenesis protein CcmH/NrfF
MNTALLWIVPPAVLAIGAVVAVILFRRRRPSGEARPLDEAEKRTLETILSGDKQP